MVNVPERRQSIALHRSFPVSSRQLKAVPAQAHRSFREAHVLQKRSRDKGQQMGKLDGKVAVVTGAAVVSDGLTRSGSPG